VASSNFAETAAIFGGRDNLFTALDNVSRSYKPRAIGISSTCLSETIGENVPMYLKQYLRERADTAPALFYASTPSYRGTHMDGFHEALFAAVSSLTGSDSAPAEEEPGRRINLISSLVSTEDLRELHRILSSFGAPYTLLPDYSETMDGVSWETYQKLGPGGTEIEDIRKMRGAAGTLYLGHPPGSDAGRWLEERHAVPLRHGELPIGIENNDSFFAALADLAGKETPELWIKERGRLIDAYIDGHKYLNGKRALIYGEEDFVCALASFLDEVGVVPVIAATGASGGSFKERVRGALRNTRQPVEIAGDADFVEMLEMARFLKPDFVMGHSKGLFLSRELGIPLVRCGFPIHDRIGGQRILHLGYRGTLNLFDLLCNSLLAAKQDQHDRGYTYL
jgi:nitrogenase molybdenum-iron protein NifN